LSTGGDGIKCCTPDGTDVLPSQNMHPACLPIIIPNDDPFFSRWNQHCMNFVRSMTVAHPDCRLGPAEQVNFFNHKSINFTMIIKKQAKILFCHALIYKNIYIKIISKEE
jgi:hypothetical protein